jgi:hypothetical protein
MQIDLLPQTKNLLTKSEIRAKQFLPGGEGDSRERKGMGRKGGERGKGEK